MPISVPVADKAAGDVLTESDWDLFIRDNINKLLNRGHRVLTVAQFTVLTALEDGDEVYLEVDASNGVMWHLRYVLADPTSFKWRFLGGPSMVSAVATAQSTTATAYADLATDGPSVTLPRGGDYHVEGEARAHCSSGFIGGSTGIHVNAVEVLRIAHFAGGGVDGAATARGSVLHTGAAASQIAKLRYKTSVDTATFINRLISVRPVRIRHDA